MLRGGTQNIRGNSTFYRETPFIVNHICYLQKSCAKTIGSKRGLQSSPASKRDKVFND